MEDKLKIRLTHLRAEGPTIEVLNLPSEEIFMSPLRLRALGEAMITAASDCSAKIRGRMLNEPIELEYDVQFFGDALLDQGDSMLVKMVQAFGVRRFTPDELDQLLNPNRDPGFKAKDLKTARLAAASMVRRGLLAKELGPNGGLGWVLRDAAVMSVKRLLKSRPGTSEL